MYEIIAELVFIIHFTFIVFAVFGGLIFFISSKIIYFHLPALIWGLFIQLTQSACPLTYVEQWFLRKSDLDSFSGGFIENYLVPIVYPINLTEDLQKQLAIGLLVINAIIYGLIIIKSKKT